MSLDQRLEDLGRKAPLQSKAYVELQMNAICSLHNVPQFKALEYLEAVYGTPAYTGTFRQFYGIKESGR